MASDRARGEGQYSPSREQDGVRTGGNSPVPGVVESSGVNVGPREFSSIKQAVPKFYDKPENCLLYTSPSPRDLSTSRMPSSA